jgi:hypothetical protein
MEASLNLSTLWRKKCKEVNNDQIRKFMDVVRYPSVASSICVLCKSSIWNCVTVTIKIGRRLNQGITCYQMMHSIITIILILKK